MKINQRLKHDPLNNTKGFLLADFVFSMALVVGCCIILFGLTFSLVSVEIAQYITWSAARSYAAGHKDEAKNKEMGRLKFELLAKRFPLITGKGEAESPFFTLTLNDVGDVPNLSQIRRLNTLGSSSEPRQPWTGVETTFDVLLLKKMRIPFIGKITTDDENFSYAMRGFLIRHPSQEECLQFFRNRYQEGIATIENNWGSRSFLTSQGTQYSPNEDNGC